MKQRLRHIITGFALIASVSGCATCAQYSYGPSVQLDRDDPYMYWVCAYFRDAKGRWPTSTPDLVSFLHSDYSNMVREIESNYTNTAYETTSEDMLIMRTSASRSSETMTIRRSTQGSMNADLK